jgi:hypothetical protein
LSSTATGRPLALAAFRWETARRLRALSAHLAANG